MRKPTFFEVDAFVAAASVPTEAAVVFCGLDANVPAAVTLWAATIPVMSFALEVAYSIWHVRQRPSTYINLLQASHKVTIPTGLQP